MAGGYRHRPAGISGLGKVIRSQASRADNLSGALGAKASKEYVRQVVSVLDGGDLDPTGSYPFTPDLTSPDAWVTTTFSGGAVDVFSLTEPTIGTDDELMEFTATGTAGEYEMHITRTGSYATWILPIWFLPQPIPTFTEQPTGLRVDGQVKSGGGGYADIFAMFGQKVGGEAVFGTEPYSDFSQDTEFWIQSGADIDGSGWSLDSARYPATNSFYDQGPAIPGGPYASAYVYFRAVANGDGAFMRNVTVIDGELP